MHIVSVDYKVGLDVIDALLPAHIEFLRAQMEAGRFLISGRKEPRTGGVILSSVNDPDELMDLLRQDPFFVNDAAQYTLIRFTPNMSGEALAFLKEG